MKTELHKKGRLESDAALYQHIDTAFASITALYQHIDKTCALIKEPRKPLEATTNNRQYFIDKIINGDFSVKNETKYDVVIEVQGGHLFTFLESVYSYSNKVFYYQFMTKDLENYMFLDASREESYDMHQAIDDQISYKPWF